MSCEPCGIATKFRDVSPHQARQVQKEARAHCKRTHHMVRVSDGRVVMRYAFRGAHVHVVKLRETS